MTSAEDAVERAYLLAQDGDVDAALTILVGVVADPDAPPGAWYNLGQMQYAKGDFRSAIASYSTAIDRGFPSQNNRGLAFEALGELDQADVDYAHALAADPDDVYALVNRGRLRLSLEDFEVAEALLRRAAELDPTANWSLADVYDATDRKEQAIEALDAAIQAGEVRAHVERGLLAAELGDDAGAARHLRLGIQANVAGARREFAIYLDLRGEPEVGLEVAREGILDGDALCYAPAAVIAEELGYIDMAIEYYRHAISAGDTGYEDDLAALLQH